MPGPPANSPIRAASPLRRSSRSLDALAVNGGVSSLRRRRWSVAVEREHRAAAEHPRQVGLDVADIVSAGHEQLLGQLRVGDDDRAAEHRQVHGEDVAVAAARMVEHPVPREGVAEPCTSLGSRRPAASYARRGRHSDRRLPASRRRRLALPSLIGTPAVPGTTVYRGSCRVRYRLVPALCKGRGR